MKNKAMILMAMLAMMLTASVPMVMAQQAPPPPEPPGPTASPAAGPVVGCQTLFNDPTATCPVDDNGDITLPDGSQAPVVVDANGNVFFVDENGNLTPAGEGASFISGEEPAGVIQYENADDLCSPLNPDALNRQVPGCIFG